MTTMFLPAMSGPRADLERRRDRGAGRDADRDALELRARAAPWSKAVSLPTVTTSSMTERVEDVGHEAGADALDLVRPGLAAGEHRRCPPARPRRS